MFSRLLRPSLLSLFLALGLHSAPAAVLIDFGGVATTNPDSFGHYWNNFASGAVTNVSLINDANGAAGFTLTSSGFGGTGAGAAVPATSGYPSTAYDDYAYLNNAASQSTTLTFNGLSLSNVYAFTIYSSRTATGTRNTTFTATGANSDGFTVNSVGNTALMTISNIAPTALGTITLTLSNNSSQFGYLNFLQVTPTAVPEPTSAALLGLALAAFVARRRRKS